MNIFFQMHPPITILDSEIDDVQGITSKWCISENSREIQPPSSRIKEDGAATNQCEASPQSNDESITLENKPDSKLVVGVEFSKCMFEDENEDREPQVKKKRDRLRISLDSAASQFRGSKAVRASRHSLSCKFCDKTFRYASSLHRHERSHTGDRPFVCKVCNKGFIQTPHLRTHELIHASNRPFVCKVCDKSFTNSSKLQRHKCIPIAKS